MESPSQATFFLFVSFLIISPLITLSSSPLRKRDDQSMSLEPPCPLDWNSAPCVCSGHAKAPIIDCSAAEWSEQLTNVFGGVRGEGMAFVEFTIYHSNITSLPFNPFASSNFTKFTIIDARITQVPGSFFQSSENTVVQITISKTDITSFPFESLQGYSKLQHLILEENQITTLPSNAFGEKGLPQLLELSLRGNEIITIGSYAFSNLPFLYRLNLAENNLTTLQANAFSMKNHRDSVILTLTKNFIHEIDKNAFEGLTFSAIHLESNQLDHLEKSAFEPFLELMSRSDSSLYVMNNPISCNTTLTWLVEKPLALKQHIRDLVCPDGKILEALTKEDLINNEKIQSNKTGH